MSNVSRRGAAAFATLALMAALFAVLAVAPAGAARFGSSGTVNACYIAKGKKKGSLRLVGNRSSCRKRRGERPLSWSVGGPIGGAGQQGQRGPSGEPGASGSESAQGPAGQIEKTTLETIQTQAKEISTLTQEVADLGGQVTALEASLAQAQGTLTSACAQLSKTTKQVDDLQTVLGNLGLTGTLLNLGLGTLNLDVPTLPAPLGAFSCT